LKKELIHSRNIVVNCYETDEERLIVEGFLTDERLFPYVVHALHTNHDPGVIHHIGITMELSIPEMKIISIRADMPTVPDPGCRDTKGAVEKLAGQSIRPGFTNEVKQRLGKTNGCLHLTNLILAISSAAVQGLWSYLSRVRDGVAPPLPGIDIGVQGAMFIDSCLMWREDGPFVSRFRQQMKARKEEGLMDTSQGSAHGG
jgi:hypothetical protein